MRSIAIPVADREECAFALEVTFGLANKLGADVVGYHMLPNRRNSGANNRLSISAVWSPVETWPEPDEKAASKAADSAHKLFELKAAQHGYEISRKHGNGRKLHAIWREKLGTPDKLMPLVGPLNDLMVVSRPKPHGGIKALLVMTSALLDSGIPVMVLPQKKIPVPCKHIAVAWNRGAQEAQAVHSTLPLLMAAEHVTFLTMGNEYKHGPSAREMISYLKSYNIKALEHKVTGKGGAGLVEAARKVGADVLLSGAYTKGRLRQMLFGGVTEYLVGKADFPVILKHT